MAARNTARRDRHRAAIRRDQPPCHICGEPIDYSLPHLDDRAFVIDHIVALNRGGTDTLANIKAAHRACNRDKSDKPFSSIIRGSGSIVRPRTTQGG